MLISICMPYRDRWPALAASLSQYRRLYGREDRPLSLEIIVVDDGSMRDPLPVSFVHKCAPFKGVAVHLPTRSWALNPCGPLNRALMLATGDLIVLTNPEVIHAEPVLEIMAAAIEDPLDYVQAPVKGLSGPGVADPNWAPFPDGAGPHHCVMFSRALLEAVGGFDLDYRQGRGCDDNDWAWRVWSAGGRFKWADARGVSAQSHERTEWPAKTNRRLLAQKWGPAWREAFGEQRAAEMERQCLRFA